MMYSSCFFSLKAIRCSNLVLSSLFFDFHSDLVMITFYLGSLMKEEELCCGITIFTGVLLVCTIWGKHPIFMLIQISIKLIVDFGGHLPY